MNKLIILTLVTLLGAFTSQGTLEASHKKSAQVSISVHEGYFYNDEYFEPHSTSECTHECPHHAQHRAAATHTYIHEGCYYYYSQPYFQQYYCQGPYCNGWHPRVMPPVQHHHVYHHYKRPPAVSSYNIGFFNKHFGFSFGESRVKAPRRHTVHHAHHHHEHRPRSNGNSHFNFSLNL